ncbi:MAG TPA: family 43 glycosylhydrolase [Bryobacteraceae bacterium]|nr:family 43 glycosylhydrolase [Bryobacteraceae bacterium]
MSTAAKSVRVSPPNCNADRPTRTPSLVAALSLLAVVGSFCTISTADTEKREPELLKLDGDISPVHDPVIIKEKNIWYVFSTGGAIRRSTDLHHWTLAGNVFEKLPAWVTSEIPGVRGGYWAPDISFHNGIYRLYYAVSTFGKNDSAIGLATNKTLDPDSPDYKWIDEGLVFRSHHGDDFNAIDPNLAVDEKGGQWLDFGSFWGGIKMRRIDPETGKLSTSDGTLYPLASRPRGSHPAKLSGAPGEDAIEAPFIVRRGTYYYLFVSFDFCCRGANSTYNVDVGRSTTIAGPYQDMQGRPMMERGGTRLTTGTSLWRGPGHEGILLQPVGPDLMVFHAYDAATGRPSLEISTLTWDRGWPQVAPLPGDPMLAQGK